MIFYLSLPIMFLKFWYYEAPFKILIYFASLNIAFLQLFSLLLFIRTFFWPIKNEYRKGLVGFSIGMGMVIKLVLIMVDSIIFLIMLLVELLILFLFVSWPIVTLLLLIK